MVKSVGRRTRAVLLDLLSDVLIAGRTLADAEAVRDGALADFEPRDRAFVRRRALSTLRRLGEIDAAIAKRLKKPLNDPAARTRLALRIAVGEILDAPDAAHAAVDAAVALVKEEAPPLAGLVNAVARRIAERPPNVDVARAARLNTPDWLWGRLASERGGRVAAGIGRGHGGGAPLDLTMADPTTAFAWAAKLDGALTPTGSVRLAPSGPVPALDGYADGAWWVQDAAAALPVRLAGGPPRADATALDMCAAPGGKTLQLAAAGWRVVALDASAERMTRVQDNLARTRLAADLVVADALDWDDARRFDLVLLDAPCSATGTIRRHPELPWTRDGSALSALTAAQDALLDAAWARVAPGGRLVYCVCSLLEVEGAARAEAFEARASDAVRAATEPAALGADPTLSELLDAAGRLSTHPGLWAEIGGLDGFFAAAWDRPAA